MRYYIQIIAVLAIAAFSGGCTKKSDTASIQVKPPVIREIKDVQALADAIENITSNPSLWTQERYDSLCSTINSLEAANVIQSADAHLENLYVLSVSCLKNRVDKEFTKSVYSNYSQLKRDLAFLKDHNDFLYDLGITDTKPDPRLNDVQDIFTNYEAVLGLSKSNFGQKARIMQPYSGDYTGTKNKIESNKYYSKYFCHNSEIKKGVSEFPSRLTTSKNQYYRNLEKLIEEEIVEKKMSSAESLRMLGDFQKITTGQNQDKVLDKLKTFVTNYNNELNKQENETPAM